MFPVVLKYSNVTFLISEESYSRSLDVHVTESLIEPVLERTRQKSFNSLGVLMSPTKYRRRVTPLGALYRILIRDRNTQRLLCAAHTR